MAQEAMIFSLTLCWFIVAAAAAASCNDTTTWLTGVGLTAKGSWYNTSNQATPGACCQRCAQDQQRCQAWTWHSSSNLCAITSNVVRNDQVKDATSGFAGGCDPPFPPEAKQQSPNIVLILTDDQDLMLGGWEPLKKAQQLLNAQGATAKNWMIHTPVCCPSRAELLTGRYFHNVKVPRIQEKSCMHAHTDPNGPFTSWLFAQHLFQAGYRVGIFGKYLNSDVPTCSPPGVEAWLANGGGNYMNPTFNTNQGQVQFNNGTYADYSTSVIGNVSTQWLRHVAINNSRPFLAYIAPKAPHIQDGPGWPAPVPAPWYADTFPNLTAPRSPNFNFSAVDHHPMIAQQPPLTDEQDGYMNNLYRRRWQSLLSVDDIIESVVNTLAETNQLDNTYIVSTADHGYRFGQFRMPMGKWNVYDNDLRIPMVIRGPGIQPGSSFEHIATNVDMMPTLLGLAGIDTPATMDGKSIAPLLVDANAEHVTQATREHIARQSSTPWRTALLIEYNGLGNVERYQHQVDSFNNTYRALRVISNTTNLLFAEFTDLQTNYNWTQAAYFHEAYDLNTDPYQMHNIYASLSEQDKQAYAAQLARLYACRGEDCN